MEKIKRCGNCGRFLGESDFYCQDKIKGRLQSNCIKCQVVMSYIRRKTISWRYTISSEARERKNKYNRGYYTNNKKKIRKQSRQWQKDNCDKVNYNAAKRHAAKLNANVPWANQEVITYIYSECAILNELYPRVNGRPKFNVDHYYPLISDKVCGLNHENNLHIMEAKENISKNNKCPEYDLPLNRK